MYSKGPGRGGKHEWVSAVDNIGVTSYINIQAYLLLAGTPVVSSISCIPLACTTFLRVPPSHILLSLAEYQNDLHRQDVISPAASPVTLITLPPGAVMLLSRISDRRADLQRAVRDIASSITKKGASVTVEGEIVGEIADAVDDVAQTDGEDN